MNVADFLQACAGFFANGFAIKFIIMLVVANFGWQLVSWKNWSKAFQLSLAQVAAIFLFTVFNGMPR